MTGIFKLYHYDRIQELNNRLSQALTSAEMRQVIEQEVAIVREEKASQTATSSMTIWTCRKFAILIISMITHCTGPQAELPKAKVREIKAASITQWNQEQLQLLVKGVNLYPPGTADRLAIKTPSTS